MSESFYQRVNPHYIKTVFTPTWKLQWKTESPCQEKQLHLNMNMMVWHWTKTVSKCYMLTVATDTEKYVLNLPVFECYFFVISRTHYSLCYSRLLWWLLDYTNRPHPLFKSYETILEMYLKLYLFRGFADVCRLVRDRRAAVWNVILLYGVIGNTPGPKLTSGPSLWDNVQAACTWCTRCLPTQVSGWSVHLCSRKKMLPCFGPMLPPFWWSMRSRSSSSSPRKVGAASHFWPALPDQAPSHDAVQDAETEAYLDVHSTLGSWWTKAHSLSCHRRISRRRRGSPDYPIAWGSLGTLPREGSPVCSNESFEKSLPEVISEPSIAGLVRKASKSYQWHYKCQSGNMMFYGEPRIPVSLAPSTAHVSCMDLF